MNHLPLPPEIMARNYISRHYLKSTIPQIISGLRYHYGIEADATEVSRIARGVTQGMCLRANMTTRLPISPESIIA